VFQFHPIAEYIKAAHVHCIQVMLTNVSFIYDGIYVALEIKPIRIEKALLIATISINNILLSIEELTRETVFIFSEFSF
jgi:hypothetical protein